jgi:hypothetical protein
MVNVYVAIWDLSLASNIEIRFLKNSYLDKLKLSLGEYKYSIQISGTKLTLVNIESGEFRRVLFICILFIVKENLYC